MNSSAWKLLGLAAVVLAAGLGGARWMRHEAPLAVRLALPTQINSAPVFVGQARGLFANAGVALQVQAVKLSKDAPKAVVADTPVMLANL